MKQAIILLLLVLKKDCDASKRSVDAENPTSANASFQVNVSAGYGVHPDNVPVTTVFPIYRFQERQTPNETKFRNHQDQVSQPSQSIPEVLPSPSYQVHEKGPEVQEKNFPAAKHHRLRSVDKRLRPRPNETRRPAEVSEPMRHEALAGTKIVEVLRVPAMYELHLQSDPQRLVSLNNAWLGKLMNQNLNKRLISQPVSQFSGAEHSYQQPPSSGLNFIQTAASTNYQRLSNALQNSKAKFPQRPTLAAPNSGLKVTHQVPQVPNHGNYRQSYVRSQNYQNSYQKEPQQNRNQNNQNTLAAAESTVKKLVQEATSQGPLSYSHLNNEITSEFYQKPQALHEVPAPVLDKQSHKYGTPSKLQITSVPSLVYGKPVEPAYQTTTQSPFQASTLWGGNLQEQNTLNGFNNNLNGLHSSQNLPPTYQYDKGQAIIPAYFQQPLTSNLYTVPQQNLVGAYSQNQYQSQSQPTYHNQNFINSLQNYKGYKHIQNYYNDAIGDYLDQNLVNVNGAVVTAVNGDGTMTVSNFHHNPKLYQPPPSYDVPVTEDTKEDATHGHEFGVMPYATQDQDLTEYNNPMYPEVAAENNQETSENQNLSLQNTADLSKMLLAAARSSAEEEHVPKYDSMSGHGRKYMAKRIMFPRRRTEPMDYILYIKERRFD